MSGDTALWDELNTALALNGLDRGRLDAAVTRHLEALARAERAEAMLAEAIRVAVSASNDAEMSLREAGLL